VQQRSTVKVTTREFCSLQSVVCPPNYIFLSVGGGGGGGGGGKYVRVCVRISRDTPERFI